MTPQDFKAKYPHLSHLEGSALWDAMEDSYIIEHANDKRKEVSDWKGNAIKEGDEICFIKIKTGSGFLSFSIMIPNGDGSYEKIESPAEPEKDCWEVGEYLKVEKEGRYLFVNSKCGEYTVQQEISLLTFCMSERTILAIKGVSDSKE